MGPRGAYLPAGSPPATLAGEQAPSRAANTLVWRGPRAPAALPAAPSLVGTIQEHTLASSALRVPRRLTVYRPPHHQGLLPGCVLADGESARSFAEVLEPAILAGAVPPMLKASPPRPNTIGKVMEP